MLDALKKAGFEVTEEQDLVKTADRAGTSPSTRTARGGRGGTSGLSRPPWWGRNITHYLVLALETVGIAPKGSMGPAGS